MSKLAVRFKDLRNDGNKVREVVSYQGDTIKVFEPTREVMHELYSLQEKFLEQSETDQPTLSGEDVVYLMSKLTDIEGLDDLEEEEIQDIINNPSPALLMVQDVIDGIVTDVYKHLLLSAKNRLSEIDFQSKFQSITQSTFNLAEAYGMESPDTSEYFEKISKAKTNRKNVISKQEFEKRQKEKQAEKEQNSEVDNSTQTTDSSAYRQPEVSKTREEQANLLKEFEEIFKGD